MPNKPAFVTSESRCLIIIILTFSLAFLNSTQCVAKGDCVDSVDPIWLKGGVKQFCSGIDETSLYCTWQVFKDPCPKSCGLCETSPPQLCRNSNLYVFWSGGQRKGCRDVNTSSIFCTWPKVQLNCPKSCGLCEISTSPSPQVIECANSKDPIYLKGGKKKYCNEVNEMSKYCTWNIFRENCPKSCGSCNLPKIIPSDRPSIVSNIPSFKISLFPTSPPSISSTNIPSVIPSSNPTSTPNTLPTAIPSALPTMIPTTEPSTSPTFKPSIESSNIPTGKPSNMLSILPTITLTTEPSLSPTLKPSKNPSLIPTSVPSVIPTLTLVVDKCIDSKDPIYIQEGKIKKCRKIKKNKNQKKFCDLDIFQEKCPKLCGICKLPSSVPSTLLPTISEATVRVNEIKRIVSIISNATALQNPGSPQSLALNWLTNEDVYYIYPADYNLIQRYTLAVFYFATNGDGWTMCGMESKVMCSPKLKLIENDPERVTWSNKTWLSQFHECDWGGLACKQKTNKMKLNRIDFENDKMEIDRIDFDVNRVEGTIPPELEQLSSLRYLSIEGDVVDEIMGLRGTIPRQIESLTNLIYIDMNYNVLTGKIPSEIYSLKKLKTIDLKGNLFTGSISSDVGNLVELIVFLTNNNSLDSSIPTQIGNLKKLRALSFRDNNLTGDVPSQIGSLKKLSTLHLELNLLNGSIPSALFLLTNLKGLSLHGNILSGTIPSQVGFLENLKYLYVDNNELTGTIPTEIGKLNKLRGIFLGGNNFSNSIPSEICTIKYLDFLEHDCNQDCNCCTTDCQDS